MSIRTPQRFFLHAISIFWLCSKNLNVPEVTQPALIDLYVWKATSIHHRWRISFFLKLSRRGTAVLPLAHICRQPTTWDLQCSSYIQPEKKGLCRHHFSLTLPLYPQWFLLPEPSSWQLIPFLRTPLKPHFHFVLWLAFSTPALFFACCPPQQMQHWWKMRAT